MRVSKILVILLAVLALVMTGFAYEGGGSGTSTADTVCNDGLDNDGDGKIDGEDTGCTNPLYKDDAETNFYDLDASWVFSGNSAPTDTGPTAFFGSRIIDKGADKTNWPDQLVGGGYIVNETYIKNSDEQYGGGDSINWTEIEIPSGGSTTDVTGDAELIDEPTEGQCGNSIIDGDDDTLNCPEDAGLPDDDGQSSSTVTDELSSINGEEVKYDVDDSTDTFFVREFRPSSDLPAGWTDATGECTTDSGCPNSVNEDYNSYVANNAPDFFLKDSGNEIWRVDPADDTMDNFDSVTDWAVKSSRHDVKDGTDTMPSCSDASNCTQTSMTKCVSTTEVDIYSDAGTDSITVGGSSSEYTTSSASNYGKSVDESSDSWFFSVTVDKEPTVSGSETICSETDTVYGSVCEAGKTCDSTSIDGGDSFVTVTNRLIDDGKDSTTRNYRFQKVKFPEQEVFDLNPDSNPSDTSTIEALFGSDGFTEGSTSDISYMVQDDTGHFGWDPDDDSIEQGNDPAISVSQFSLDVRSNEDFISVRDWWSSFDVDGAEGHGDGFVAVEQGTAFGKSTATLEREDEQGAPTDFVALGDVTSLNDLSCPGGKDKCVVSMDMSLDNLNTWSSRTPTASDVSFELQKARLDASYGVCKLFKNIGTDTVTCSYDNRGGGEDSDTSPTPGVCGDEPNEFKTYMEGPEVDDSVLDNHPGDQQMCASKMTQCVIKGQLVNEGTVMDVTSEKTSGYEESLSSPDMEVCLAIPNSGDTNPGDNYDYDDDGTVEEMGGEWYDLDNEAVNTYLRNGGSDLVDISSNVDSNNQNGYNSNDIDYYYTENPNSYHSTYNPEGGNEGVALEDDCGPDLTGCDDSGTNTAGKSPTFFTTFNEGDRDEDHSPLSDGNLQGNPSFNGFVNKIEDDSDQLEQSMDTVVSFSSPTWQTSFYERSISNTSIDQYAITSSLAKLVSARGNVYSPGNVYLRSGVSERTSTDDSSHSKYARVFGNSFADLATHSDGEISPDDGVWIDPDYIKEGWENGEYRNTTYFSGWRDKLTYRMDLTGPDAGLGFDIGGSGYEHIATGNVNTNIVVGDIYFEGEEDNTDNDGNGGVDEAESYDGTDIVGETTPRLEPPMCGDDRKEFLIEEMGESTNPARYDGGYACSDSIDSCVDMSGSQKIVDAGEYRNVDEPDEDIGRAKNDQEICDQTTIRGPTDSKYRWMDQDLKQEYCRENTFFRQEGVRWFDSGYVDENPEAVENGVDDDWNAYMSNESKSTVSSPVDNGNPTHSNIRTKGFCGGDDAGEFFITQRCNSRLCDTDTSVKGVVKTPGACILDGEKYSAVASDEMDTYRPGEEVTFDYGTGETRKIRCLEGQWYDKWPIISETDEMEIPLGETKTVSFYVVNPTKNTLSFDLQIEETDMQKFSEFVASGTNSRTVEVGPQRTKRVGVDAIGGKLSIDDSPIRVQASSTYSDLSGEASTDINVTEQASTPGSSPNEVPGIGVIQLIVAGLTAASVILFS